MGFHLQILMIFSDHLLSIVIIFFFLHYVCSLEFRFFAIYFDIIELNYYILIILSNLFSHAYMELNILLYYDMFFL